MPAVTFASATPTSARWGSTSASARSGTGNGGQLDEEERWQDERSRAADQREINDAQRH
jgi:hypothetical protein